MKYNSVLTDACARVRTRSNVVDDVRARWNACEGVSENVL